MDADTDRVYQYDNAASRTSGSQSASMSFALAPGNTNPQGIADPPTWSESLSPVPVMPARSQATALLDQVFTEDFGSWLDFASALDAVPYGLRGRRR